MSDVSKLYDCPMCGGGGKLFQDEISRGVADMVIEEIARRLRSSEIWGGLGLSSDLSKREVCKAIADAITARRPPS